MSDGASVARVTSLEQLAAQGQEYLATRSVSPQTDATYERLFTTKWVPLCADKGYDPYEAPPSAVKALFDAAKRGELRSERGAGQRPMEPVACSYLDSILAAVRHGYLRVGKTPPQQQDGGAHALKVLRREYKTYRADPSRRPFGEGDETASLPSAQEPPLLTLEDFQAMCAVDAGSSRRDILAQVVGLLALDLKATDHELATLHGGHFAADDHAVCVTFPGRDVRIEHTHAPTHGVTPTCLTCVLSRFLQMPPILCPDDPVFATTRKQADDVYALRTSVRRLMAVAARPWPGIDLACATGPGLALAYADGLTSRDRMSSRQGLARGSVPGGLATLRTQTAVKLAVARGLTAGDLFGRLRVGDVTWTCDGVDLRLPQYVGARDRRTTQVSVRRQADRRWCPVVALTEWLMVREAAEGPLGAEEPLFITVAAGWTNVAPHRVPRDVSLNCFKDLQRSAGLEPVYTMRSLRQLFASLAVAQGASEDQLWGALRVRKPAHARRFIDAAGGEARVAVHGVSKDAPNRGAPA